LQDTLAGFAPRSEARNISDAVCGAPASPRPFLHWITGANGLLAESVTHSFTIHSCETLKIRIWRIGVAGSGTWGCARGAFCAPARIPLDRNVELRRFSMP
jgi:hypothetical protein